MSLKITVAVYGPEGPDYVSPEFIELEEEQILELAIKESSWPAARVTRTRLVRVEVES